VAIVIVLILIVLGVHSCQISSRNSAMKDYTNNVSSLIQRSDDTGRQLFSELSSGVGSTGAQTLANEINKTRVDADAELASAEHLNVPGEMSTAQRYVLLTLQMRRDGILNIAQKIEQALGTATSKDAISSIATSMARFLASDVVYKGYAGPAIAAALHAAGIAVGPPNGELINGGQFLPDLGWLQTSFIAAKLRVQLPAAKGGKIAPGLHGHSLTSVSVAGTTLQTGSNNTIPASPPPTFTLNFANGGANSETNVKCKVTVSGTNISAVKVVPQTTAGQSTSCTVALPSAPPAGTQTVDATIEPVPGEKNTANNTLSFPVTFQ
jgi:hypothetical protein